MLLSAVPTTLVVLLALGNSVRAGKDLTASFDILESLLNCTYYFLTIIEDYCIGCLIILTLFLAMLLIKKTPFLVLCIDLDM